MSEPLSDAELNHLAYQLRTHINTNFVDRLVNGYRTLRDERDALAKLRDQGDRGGWVKVEDGLPTSRQTVLLFDGMVTFTGYYSNNGWLDSGDCLARRITHWRSLPPLPEGAPQ